jgi:hypothetical protein
MYPNICPTLGIWVGCIRRARNARSTSRMRLRRKSHPGRPQNPFGEPLLNKSTKKHTFVERPRRALEALGRARFGRTCARGVRGHLGWVRWPAWQTWLAGFSRKQTCSFPLYVPMGKSSKFPTFRTSITFERRPGHKIWDSRLLDPIM